MILHVEHMIVHLLALGGVRYRYTEWVKFLRYPHWTPMWYHVYKNRAVELYDHELDPDENHNVAFETHYKKTAAMLKQTLHQGWRAQLPTGQGAQTPTGW